MIRQEFIDQNSDPSHLTLDPYTAHTIRLRHSKPREIFAGCSICLIKDPVYHLGCHQICGDCGSRCAAAYSIQSCPFCGSQGFRGIIIQPPTAGARFLSLHGDRPHDIFKFLNYLQKSTSTPLEYLFDNIIGTGMGMSPTASVSNDELIIVDRRILCNCIIP